MSYNIIKRDERIAYALESIAKELGIMNKQISVVAKEPSADVVEVVRCKDCKHFDTHDRICLYSSAMFVSDEDSFCSYGERKETKSEDSN